MGPVTDAVAAVCSGTYYGGWGGTLAIVIQNLPCLLASVCRQNDSTRRGTQTIAKGSKQRGHPESARGYDALRKRGGGRGGGVAGTGVREAVSQLRTSELGHDRGPPLQVLREDPRNTNPANMCPRPSLPPFIRKGPPQLSSLVHSATADPGIPPPSSLPAPSQLLQGVRLPRPTPHQVPPNSPQRVVLGSDRTATPGSQATARRVLNPREGTF